MVNEVGSAPASAQVEHDLDLPEFGAVADADAHARALLAVHRQAAHLERGLDAKERGTADALAALAAGALVTGWRLEPPPRQPQRLLWVRLPSSSPGCGQAAGVQCDACT
jgi:hypothetical protein